MKAETASPRYLLESTRLHMNTSFHLCVSLALRDETLGDELIKAAHEKICEIENEMSEFREGSLIRACEQAEPHQKVSVTKFFLEVMEEAKRINLWSRGAFNPSFRSPGEGSFLDRWKLCAQDLWVEKRKEQSRLSFAAIAKGYALDQVEALFQKAGFKNYRLNAGGSSLIFSGTQDVGKPWPLGLAWQKSEGARQGELFRVTSQHLCLGISGTLEQGNHILKPPSVAHSARNLPEFSLALVSASSAMRADAFSTAIFANPELAADYVDGAWLLIDEENQLYHNQNFQKILAPWEDE